VGAQPEVRVGAAIWMARCPAGRGVGRGSASIGRQRAPTHGLASVAHESENEARRGASSEGGLFTGLVWRDCYTCPNRPRSEPVPRGDFGTRSAAPLASPPEHGLLTTTTYLPWGCWHGGRCLTLPGRRRHRFGLPSLSPSVLTRRVVPRQGYGSGHNRCYGCYGWLLITPHNTS